MPFFSLKIAEVPQPTPPYLRHLLFKINKQKNISKLTVSTINVFLLHIKLIIFYWNKMHRTYIEHKKLDKKALVHTFHFLRRILYEISLFQGAVGEKCIKLKKSQNILRCLYLCH